ncbi:MAG: deoxyribose-phosphate aldolase [Synergistaceae bacterium]
MDLEKYIDHTNLNQNATEKDIKKLCEEAIAHNFASVCVNSSYVSFAKEMLKNSEVKICSVVGFPLGMCTTSTKVFETKEAIALGADEIDMVINVGWVKDKKFDEVEKEIKNIVTEAKGKTVKVIIETCLLNEEEKIQACKIAKSAKAHFVKTATGFSTGGATAEDVKLMAKTVGNGMSVKASGGIRDKKTAILMIEAGAKRIGASKSVDICK